LAADGRLLMASERQIRVKPPRVSTDFAARHAIKPIHSSLVPQPPLAKGSKGGHLEGRAGFRRVRVILFESDEASIHGNDHLRTTTLGAFNNPRLLKR
jgi:hypothetical protein